MAEKVENAGLLKLIPPLLAILVSVGISAYWASLVPIFQSIDEDLHSDYVFCLYSGKKLMRQGQAPKVLLAHSFSKYLLDATGGQVVKWNEFEPMPNNYGCREFFRNLNTNAPRAIINGYPLLISTYPIGYYALNALWLLLISCFDSSLVTLFFAARAFSVCLFAIGLSFSYLTLRELRLSSWRAACLTAALGIMPVISYASSYIQPDNLSFASISTCFFLALRWRNSGKERCLIYLGISLMVLLLAKYQFYFCAVSAIGLLVAAKELLLRSPSITRIYHLALLLLPSLIASIIPIWLHNRMWSYPARTAYVKNAWLSGSIKNQLLNSVTSTLHSLYGRDGDCFRTFWHCFGWMDTPVVFVNAKLTYMLCSVIQWSEITVIFFVAISLLRVWASLLNSLRKHHQRLALYTFFSNPIITAYFLFLLCIFVLAFISYRSFLVQGRHWYSIILPVFWMVAVVAPRILTKQSWRKQWFWLITAAFLLYAISGNYFAVKSIRQRYYEQKSSPVLDVANLVPVTQLASADIQLFNYIPKLPMYLNHPQPLKVPDKCPLIIKGWAIDFPKHKPATMVLIYIDGNTKIIPAAYGLENPQVVEELQDEAYRYSGFGAIIPTENLSQGWHILNIKVVSSNKKFLYGTDKTFKFFIE